MSDHNRRARIRPTPSRERTPYRPADNRAAGRPVATVAVAGVTVVCSYLGIPEVGIGPGIALALVFRLTAVALRLDAQWPGLAAPLQAGLDGASRNRPVSEAIRAVIAEHVAARRRAPVFQHDLSASVERAQRLLKA
ncbi:hypothetical protein [Streptomyces mirabilis]|uniref:hypothetical protein n=1 Tax=Streptomyces mirabilis TaxID=68239 RepID=UPI0033FFAF82